MALPVTTNVLTLKSNAHQVSLILGQILHCTGA